MILLVDNYDSFTYNLYQALLLGGDDVEVVRNDKITLSEIMKLQNLKGVVLSPGPGHPRDAGICVELIKYMGSKKPILGVCLGHQALGYAYNSSITFAKKVMHGKASLVSHYKGRLFKGVSQSFLAARYHSLIVSSADLSPQLAIDAVDEDGEIMAISHMHYPSYGLQFHPESILTPNGQQFINNFVSICNEYK